MDLKQYPLPMGPGLPRLVAPPLSAEARDLSTSALGIFISALSRRVSALSDASLKRGRKRIMDQGSFIRYRKREKIKNVTRTGGRHLVRVTFLIFLFLSDLGPCFGMNEHPRRATDVILRLSRSKNRFPISFYRL